MTRGVPQVTRGLLPSVASGQRDALFDLMVSQLEAYQSNGVSAWQRRETVATRDIVFHSVGDRNLGADVNAPYFDNGDTDIFCRLRRTGTDLGPVMYQDWSSASGSGSRPNTATSSDLTFDDARQIQWLFVCNEYEWAMVATQVGLVHVMGAGNPRRWMPDAIAGVARTTVLEAGAGAVVFAIDRDISSQIVAGSQSVWVVNRTGIGDTIKTDFTELLSVTAVSATTITLAGVTGTPFEAGSLIGLDPVASYGFGAVDDGDPTGYMTNSGDTTYAIETQTTALVSATEALNSEGLDSTPAYIYHGFQPTLLEQSANVRGYPELLAHYAIGLLSDDDQVVPQYRASDSFRVFPRLGLTTTVGTWALAVGPGAT